MTAPRSRPSPIPGCRLSVQFHQAATGNNHQPITGSKKGIEIFINGFIIWRTVK
jgi:hypothetical protein